MNITETTMNKNFKKWQTKTDVTKPGLPYCTRLIVS